ncbi:S1C family serine protease [Eubacterium ventriosum]|uniref:PDZ domain-containing protein n=1 Tax=Eubacterium ventriosum TaxID=39496 RepID=A0A413S4E1_9FIRM|nr:trypsin-like peptidase domain-containing protein [Eubacterium ventriosum]RHA56568.1 PDZ domain-containing protein [Eubacterium ventriosum]
MYDNENPNGFGSNPEGNNDDNISGTENNNFEEVNSQQVSQDAVNSSEQNTEQTAEQESSVYRQSYVNDEHHNADDVSGNGTYYSQGSNNSSNDSTQNGSYYNSNSNNSQNNGYYYSTNDSQTNNGYNYNSNNNNNGNGKKKKKKRTLIAVVAVCVVLLAGTIGISAAYISKNKDSLTNVLEDGTLSKNDNNSNNDNSSDSGNYESIGSTNTQNDANSSSKSGVTVTDVSSVVSSAMPSVVAITSKTLVESGNNYSQDIWEYYFGGGNSGNNKSNSYEEDAAGSGIIVDQTSTELLIVTNNHVVEGADSLKIQFAGTESKDSVDGYIKGTDSTKDVAVVAVKLKDIPSDVLKNIKKATLGDSDKVNVGEGVIAIGNALGYGQSVTTGIISAKDREVQLENQTMTLLQTDAAINGGNSGGALLNASGEVIGINVAKYSSSGSSSNASVEGMGFAIPISSVKDIISNLETKETRTKVSEDERGYLGISGFDVDEQTSQAYSIPQGIQVQSVVKGGPAENAGIAASDVITKFDGQDVSSMTSLQSMLEYYKKGEQVKVTIEYRDGREYKTKDVTVTLGDKSVIETTQNAAN